VKVFYDLHKLPLDIRVAKPDTGKKPVEACYEPLVAGCRCRRGRKKP
jgi:hypothetical protein